MYHSTSYHYPNYVYESSAQGNFQRAQATNFPQRASLEPPFSHSPVITYTSPFADQYALGCGVDTVPACRLYARYGNYFVYMYFDIDAGTGDGLYVTDVTPILQALDQHMAVYLHMPIPPTGFRQLDSNMRSHAQIRLPPNMPMQPTASRARSKAFWQFV